MPEEKTIIIFGPENTGKSSLMFRYTDKGFKSTYSPTLGLQYHLKMLSDRTIRVKFWDSAGASRFRPVALPYYKMANAFLLVYDITNRNSFDQISTYISDAKEYAPNAPIFLVGTKADLEAQRQVTQEEVDNLVKIHRLQEHWLVSAKEDNGDITKLFEHVGTFGSKPLLEDIKEDTPNPDSLWLQKFKTELIDNIKNNHLKASRFGGQDLPIEGKTYRVPEGVDKMYKVLSKSDSPKPNYKEIKQEIFTILREREQASSLFRTKETQDFYAAQMDKIITDDFQNILGDYLNTSTIILASTTLSFFSEPDSKARWYKNLLEQDQAKNPIIKNTIYYSMMLYSGTLQNSISQKFKLPPERIAKAFKSQIPAEKIEAASNYIIQAAQKNDNGGVLEELNNILNNDTNEKTFLEKMMSCFSPF